MKTIILVTGLPGSGKTAVSSCIREARIPVFIMGDIIREEIRKRGLEFNNRNSELVAVQLRKEQGTDFVAKKMGEKINAVDDAVVCVDGAREISEAEYLSKFGKLVLLVVKSPDRIRYQRLVEAGGYKKPRNYEEFLWRSEQESGRGMGELVGTDKYDRRVIENDGSLDELKEKVKKILKEIINK